MSDRHLPEPPQVGPLRRALTAWLFRGAPAPIAALLLWAIRRDPAWSAVYDAHRRLEAAAADDVLGHVQLEQLEQRILAVTAGPPASESDRSRWALPGLALGGAGMAAAAAALLLWPAAPGEPGRGEEWKERGAPQQPAAGIQVRCLKADGSEVLDRAEAGPRAPLAGLSCPSGSVLSWAVTNLDEEPVHLFVVGLTGDDVRWYAPFTPRTGSVEVAPGLRDHILPVLADTEPFPEGEQVALYAIFSRDPLSGPAVRSQLDAAARRGRLSSALDRVPVSALWQARVEVIPTSDPGQEEEAR